MELPAKDLCPSVKICGKAVQPLRHSAGVCGSQGPARRDSTSLKHQARFDRMREQDLIHDWNQTGPDWSSFRVELNDETLRDGLQCPSVTDPFIDDKKRLQRLIVD